MVVRNFQRIDVCLVDFPICWVQPKEIKQGIFVGSFVGFVFSIYWCLARLSFILKLCGCVKIFVINFSFKFRVLFFEQISLAKLLQNQISLILTKSESHKSYPCQETVS